MTSTNISPLAKLGVGVNTLFAVAATVELVYTGNPPADTFTHVYGDVAFVQMNILFAFVLMYSCPSKPAVDVDGLAVPDSTGIPVASTHVYGDVAFVQRKTLMGVPVV